MRVSHEWLKTLVDAPDDIDAFSSRLALTGTEVESVEKIGANLDGIVVGHILTRDKHPDAEHLWVTTVDVGDPEPLQIVCGAQNFVAGDKVPVARVGTVMPDGTKIKKSRLRGIDSCGMNCSGRELGVSADHTGILILPPDAPVGMPIAQYLGISDTVLDCEITPNRPDCLSMLGMAREVGAIYDRDVTPEHYETVCEGPDAGELVSVRIDDPELCPRYTVRVIRGVKIGPSPEWLAKRVSAAGSRPINNIVDVTNYIMFSLGQPLHAFDISCLPTCSDGRRHVVVRAAGDGEKFTTLDGTPRVLSHDMAVITAEQPDGSTKAVALAGVMGGLESEVTEKTVDIMLESAAFSSSHTSRTSRNLSLVSESSLRYERGVDDNTCADFSAEAAALMAQVSGGTVCPGIVDCYPVHTRPNHLTLRVKRLQAHMGAPIPEEDAIRILTRLGCIVEQTGEPGILAVTTPTFRPDLSREIDLYEEVLRLWGMDRVAPTLPGGRGRIGGRTPKQVIVDSIDALLRASGLNETVSYSLVPADDLERLRMPAGWRGDSVQIINPMNSDECVMRRSIVPGLLRSVANNQAHGVANVRLYERGRIFSAAKGRKLPKEHVMFSAVLAGSWVENGWNQKSRELDFFDLKGVLENVLEGLSVPKVRFKALSADEAPWLLPGRGARVLAGGTELGWIGEIHPFALADFNVAGTVIAFELSADALVKSASTEREYKDEPRFPAVNMDLAVVVDEEVTAEFLERAIVSAGGKLLESVRLFDVYRNEEHLGAGKKSMAFSLVYRAADRTLTLAEVEKAHARLVKKVCGAVGGELRA